MISSFLRAENPPIGNGDETRKRNIDEGGSAVEPFKRRDGLSYILEVKVVEKNEFLKVVSSGIIYRTAP